ncbi:MULTISPECIES: topoisomerase C-terminal repeat-containing protein [Microcystis]|uniref:topoisomerase C-terminal repeat-containing protein n=1 Tax=Microcystis TaxID=1125 RepID=UPI000261EDF4|nr:MULTISPECIES: topoisomerase C-terminal repeat-containing protein [Microcystis]CCI31563.1 hypothetical protein MICAI_2010026 [Microcystis sp. T1-4]
MHGKTNAKIPEGETAETLTLERALVALATKTTAAQKTTPQKTTCPGRRFPIPVLQERQSPP